MPASSSQQATPGSGPAPQKTEIIASAQHTFTLNPGDLVVLLSPAALVSTLSQPPGTIPCFFRCKNLGPADIWARWDGGDAAINDPQSVILDQGEIIPASRSSRLTLCCDAKPAGGARVSVSIGP